MILNMNRNKEDMTKTKEESELVSNSDQLVFADKIESLIKVIREQ